MVFIITDFNTEQLTEILKNLRKQTPIDISETRHCKRRFKERSDECDRETVYDLLKTEIPDGNNKTTPNTFKIIYEHPELEDVDVYIIIAILNMSSIKLVTVYSHSSSRRKK